MDQATGTHQNITKPKSLPRRLFDRSIGQFFTFSMNTIAGSTKRLPWARRRLRSIQVSRNISYGPHSKVHQLDVYMPLSHHLPDAKTLSRMSSSPINMENGRSQPKKPFVLYLHGGGFRTLSKDTHWPFGLRFAEEGFVAFLINYRLTPQHVCPAGLEDCALALDWILTHHDVLGIDLDQGMIAGESAGGNLTLALTLALIRPDGEPWAQRVFRHQWSPKMIAPACAFLEVSSEGRLDGEMPPFYMNRVNALGRAYLNQSSRPDLASPLEEFNSDQVFTHPCPPVFVTVGDKDIVKRDSERLVDSLRRRGTPHEFVTYPGGIHAFHAAIFHPLAESCWRDHFRFWAQLKGDNVDCETESINVSESVGEV